MSVTGVRVSAQNVESDTDASASPPQSRRTVPRVLRPPRGDQLFRRHGLDLGPAGLEQRSQQLGARETGARPRVVGRHGARVAAGVEAEDDAVERALGQLAATVDQVDADPKDGAQDLGC